MDQKKLLLIYFVSLLIFISCSTGSKNNVSDNRSCSEEEKELLLGLNSTNGKAVNSTFNEIDSKGQSIVPCLIESFLSKENKNRKLVAKALLNLSEKDKNITFHFSNVPKLISLMKEDNDEIKKVINYSLVVIGKEAISPLIKQLRNKDKKIKKFALEIIALLNVEDLNFSLSEEDIEGLLLSLRDKDKYVRNSSAIILSKATQDYESIISSLLDLIFDQSFRVRNSAALALKKIQPKVAYEKLLVLLGKYKKEKKSRIIDAIRTIGLISDNGINELKKAAYDQSSFVRASSVRALAVFANQKILEVLIVSLNDNNKDVREAAIRALEEREYRFKELTPKLIKILKNSSNDLKFRKSAAAVLSSIGKKMGRFLPDFVQEINSEDYEIRRIVALGLIKMRKNIKLAVPVLQSCIQKNKMDQKISCIKALGKIGRSDKKTISILIKLTDSKNSFVQGVSIKALLDMQVNLDSKIKALIRELKSKKSKNKILVLKKLSMFGDKAKASIPHLIKMTEGNDLKLIKASSNALAKVGKKDEKSTLALINLLRQGDIKKKEIAVLALIKMGPKAEKSIPYLIQSFKNYSSDRLTLFSIVALGNMGVRAKSALPDLIDSYKKSHIWSSKVFVLGAINEVGGGSEEALSITLDALNDKDERVRPSSAGFLDTNLYRDVKRLLPVMALLVKSKNETIRLYATRSLGKLNLEPKKIVPILIKRLSDKSEEVREAAAVSLASFGGIQNDTIDQLNFVLENDSHSYVRNAAYKSIEKITGIKKK